MTEKRFISKDESIINVVTDELVNASSEEGAKILVDWLNELSDKYVEQRKENYGLLDGIAFYKEENASLSEKISDLECENEQLKQTVSDWSGSYDELFEDVKRLEEKNEQLKKELDKLKVVNEMLSMDFTNSEHELWKENKQLKETIDELRTIDKEKDIEVEHINNIYKEFGFKGLIDYAKEKLYNFGAVREVDDGLWLLATGGWSDNEFWLDCLLHWNFMYAKGHYRATTSGGGYYYSEKPYADIKVVLEDLE